MVIEQQKEGKDMTIYCVFMVIFMFWWSSAGIVFTYLYNRAYDILGEVGLTTIIILYVASVFWFISYPYMKYSACKKSGNKNEDDKEDKM